MKRIVVFLVVLAFCLGGAEKAYAQTQASDRPLAVNPKATGPEKAPDDKKPSDKPKASEKTTEGEDEQLGFRLPDSDRLRVTVSFLAAYGYDAGNADKGFETQGRVGSAIITMAGRLN